MLFIGICGASGSGKSTLSDELCQAVGVAKSIVINQDSYYYDHLELSLEERTKLNYDEPFIFDHDLLYEDIAKLLRGEPITKKGYDFTQHRRCDSYETIAPGDILILEGIHSFHDEKLRELMYLKLYINVEPDICLLRRVNRDIKERRRSIDSITTQYLSTVKPMYDRYIRNYIEHADVIVTRGGKNARIVDILAGYLRNALSGVQNETWE
ncbi:MAG: uridine kinase [Eubacteriales bacterium]|jgi:uridine kinase|nr:uridine kinase [Eubacteriales bacterium]MDD4104567.1 uridine kinase [Eubacteriales bacterium]MDD4710743.1 uridine kinase [Eubacteriales bacterium]NLO14991.1 uridine kinase [Clostridiales bacterium]